MDRRFLVLDIETIVDSELAALMFGGPGVTTEQIQENIKVKYPSGFLPPAFQVPVCIALIDVDADTCKVCNAVVIASADEKLLLQRFWKIVRFRKGNIPVKSTLVHFNGRGFDLPVLFYRSMKHRIPVITQEDRSRYSFEESHDICDDLSGFGASSRPSLNLISKLIGLPGKTDIDGSAVEELYSRGELSRIKDYCMSDALATYQVWLTMRYIRNQINEEKFNEAFQSAEGTVQDCRQVTDEFFSS